MRLSKKTSTIQTEAALVHNNCLFFSCNGLSVFLFTNSSFYKYKISVFFSILKVKYANYSVHFPLRAPKTFLNL